MTIEQLIGQFTAYTEYPNQDTFVISNQTCQDIVKYLTELQAIKDEPPTNDWEHYADRLWVRAYAYGLSEGTRNVKEE